MRNEQFDPLAYPAPWTIGDRTHYGTEIFDADANKILSVWICIGSPSAREKGNLTDEEWRDRCCDTHWESETQWHIANAIIAARNALMADRWYHHTHLDTMRTLISLCRETVIPRTELTHS